MLIFFNVSGPLLVLLLIMVIGMIAVGTLDALIDASERWLVKHPPSTMTMLLWFVPGVLAWVFLLFIAPRMQ